MEDNRLRRIKSRKDRDGENTEETVDRTVDLTVALGTGGGEPTA